MRNTFVIILPLLLLASPTGAQRTTSSSASARAARANADPFCRDIAQIIREAATDFERDKGAYRTDSERWVSTIFLPNANNCWIDELSFEHGASHDQSANLTCTWNTAGAEDALATADAMSSQLRACIGVNWPGSLDRGGSARELYRFRLFYSPGGAGADFTIRVSTTRSTPQISLMVTSTYYKPASPSPDPAHDPNNFDPRVRP